MIHKRLLLVLLVCTVGCGNADDPSIVPQAVPGGACEGMTECPPRPSGAGAEQTEAIDRCDGRDNDRDGQIDEADAQRVCNTECASGVQLCKDGRWSDCDAQRPESEMCDKVDNDCDGSIDETLTQVCDTPCGMGVRTCSLGQWSECIGPSISKEICDNLDNDCDGLIDENLLEACVTACANGYKRCTQGVFGDCDARQPSMEVCGDLVDNDCDEQTDEMCDCAPNEMRTCSTNTGACQSGIQTCEGNGVWSPCLDSNGAVVMSPGQDEETCNNIDDDCNGVTDDVPSMPCGPDEIGACRKGQSECNGGVLICAGEVTASEERCDRVDNDCDGVTDEGLVDGDLDARDAYEPNPRCDVARSLGSISHTSRIPRALSGSLYPVGDEDWYRIEVSEGRNFCLPFVGPADPSYELRIDLSNLPAGADYRICAHLSEVQEPPSAGCAPERHTSREICSEGANGNGLQTISFTVDGNCGSDDSVMLFVRVYAPMGSTTYCEPYTLSISSRQL